MGIWNAGQYRLKSVASNMLYIRGSVEPTIVRSPWTRSNREARPSRAEDFASEEFSGVCLWAVAVSVGCFRWVREFDLAQLLIKPEVSFDLALSRAEYAGTAFWHCVLSKLCAAPCAGGKRAVVR